MCSWPRVAQTISGDQYNLCCPRTVTWRVERGEHVEEGGGAAASGVAEHHHRAGGGHVLPGYRTQWDPGGGVVPEEGMQGQPEPFHGNL